MKKRGEPDLTNRLMNGETDWHTSRLRNEPSIYEISYELTG